MDDWLTTSTERYHRGNNYIQQLYIHIPTRDHMPLDTNI